MESAPRPLPILGVSRLTDVRATRTAAGAAQLDEAARTPLQATLAEICAEVLGLSRLGIHDNFFELGGNSLNGTQVITRVRAVLGVALPLGELFETPTVAALAARVEAAQRGGQSASEAIPHAPRGAPLPLSFAQERLWFIHQLDPGSTAYHTLLPVRVTGALDVAALERSLAVCVARHEALRTTFAVVGGQPRQVIAPHGALPFTVVDLTNEPAETRAAHAHALAAVEARRPFDLAAGPLVRVVIYRLSPHDHLWLTVMHHIISDAWSLAVLIGDMAAVYSAEVGGTPPQLRPLTHQPADFAVWQRQQPDSAQRADLDYWRKQLAGLSVLDLPTDRPRPARQTFRGAREAVELSPDLAAGVQALSQSAGVTPSMVVLAAFTTLLYRYTGQSDVAVGLSIANRAWLASEGLISAFVNTLALRTDLSGAPTFSALLARVRATALAAYTHQNMPFAQLVAELNPERRLDQAPLVQVMFNFINVPTPSGRPAGLEFSGGVPVDHGGAQFDLSLQATEVAAFRRLMLEYNTDLFDAATIQRMLGHLTTLLAAALADPDTPIDALPLLSAAERHTLQVAWNATDAPYPQASVPALFAAQVARTPAAVALRAGHVTQTYAELAQAAAAVAHRLAARGVGPGAVVGVCVPRTPELIAALLGTMQAGAAYLPLDPAYPPERLRWMAAEARAALIITAAATDDLWAGQALPRLRLDQPAPAAAVAFTPPALPPDAPAYVLFTSGSTGQPKAVVAPHRGLVNRLAWQWQAYPYAAGEVAVHKTALNFVDAAAEIFAPLLAGVPLVLAPAEAARDPAELVALLAAERISRVTLVPALLRTLLRTVPALAERLPALRVVISSGEPLDPALCAAFHQALPHATLLNLYGTTEVAGDVAYHDATLIPADAASVPLGRPIANTQLYVLDANGQLAPVGVPGEIYAGGAGLALGYLHQPALTEARFAPATFGSPGQRLYRTGDRGRWLADGTLHYLGRRDQQLKLRGVRIEPAEVEAALRRQASVRDAVVIARPSPAGEAWLVAYVVADDATPTADLTAELRQELPAPLLPGAVVRLSALPRLPNGKVDSAALPEPERAGATNATEAPLTPLEAKIAAAWAAALHHPAVGRHDNFFELGGHSLLAVDLLAQLEAATGLRLPVRLIFQAPTVAELAAALSAPAASQPGRALVPLQPHGTRPPIYILHPLGGGVGDYLAIARHLAADQPVYGLRARGLEEPDQAALSLEALAASYVQEVRAFQPVGPYHLGGYSSGGLLAYEMARQLTVAGGRVALVALLDSYAPSVSNGRGLPPEALANLLTAFPHWLGDFVKLGPDKMLARLNRRLRAAGQAQRAPDLRDFVDDDLSGLPAGHRAFMQAHYAAILAYRPQPYAGVVTLFRARAQALSRALDPNKGWAALALGGLMVREIAGSHHTLLSEPAVADLGQQLQAELDRVQA